MVVQQYLQSEGAEDRTDVCRNGVDVSFHFVKFRQLWLSRIWDLREHTYKVIPHVASL